MREALEDVLLTISIVVDSANADPAVKLKNNANVQLNNLLTGMITLL